MMEGKNEALARLCALAEKMKAGQHVEKVALHQAVVAACDGVTTAAARGDVRGLVERLRHYANVQRTRRLPANASIADEAADTLEALAAEGVQAGEVECDCPGKGKDDPALHAPNCPARLSQQPEARGAPLEPAGKPVGWWNGISNDWLGPEGSPPSIRWGADAEDSGHDIPLYSGYNPIHFAKPEARGVVDEAIKAALAELDALRGAMFKTYAAAANGADKSKLLALIEAERNAYENHYSQPRLQAALTGERNG